MSKAEDVLGALKATLATALGADVKRNAVVPERLGPGGLVIIRDGAAELDEVLGDQGPHYYTHTIPLEIIVAAGETEARDAAFDALLSAIGAALDDDPTLGGAVFGMSYGRPVADTEHIVGAPDQKAATLDVTVEYQSPTRI